MLWLDPNDSVTPVLIAMREFAEKNRCYNKTAFRERLTEAGTSAPEILLGRFAYNILERLHDRLFCEAIELRYCQPLTGSASHSCQCNKVMVSWDDRTNEKCDRVTVSKVKMKGNKLDCNTALADNKCSFDHEVHCGQRPGVEGFDFDKLRATKLKQSKAECMWRCTEAKLDYAEATLADVKKILSGKLPSVQVAGKVPECKCDVDADSDDEVDL